MDRTSIIYNNNRNCNYHLGTNYLLGEVSYTTYSIAAILQLVLTMDYSIMLLNRYREEKENNKNNNHLNQWQHYRKSELRGLCWSS